jgi:DNA-binding NarL/FixJ family response regulator
VADGSRLFADALSFVLVHEAMTVLGTASSAAEAFALVERRQPTLLVVGLPLPGANPIPFGRELRRRYPAMNLLAMVGADGPDIAMLLEGGYSGAVRREVGSMSLVAAVSAAARGQRVVHAMGSVANARTHEEFLLEQLTARELQVLKLLADGTNSEDIARGLGVKPNTVRTHVQNILMKLNVNSRLEAVSLAIRLGL